MMTFTSFIELNWAIFKLPEKIQQTDRQTDRQTEKPSYKSSSPELKNSWTSETEAQFGNNEHTLKLGK